MVLLCEGFACHHSSCDTITKLLNAAHLLVSYWRCVAGFNVVHDVLQATTQQGRSAATDGVPDTTGLIQTGVAQGLHRLAFYKVYSTHAFAVENTQLASRMVTHHVAAGTRLQRICTTPLSIELCKAVP
jgi:hypothetical protein